MVIAFATCSVLLLGLSGFAIGMAWLEDLCDLQTKPKPSLDPMIDAEPPAWVLSFCDENHWTEPHRDNLGFWRAFPPGAVIPPLVPRPWLTEAQA